MRITVMLDAVNMVVRAGYFIKSDNIVLVSLKFKENAPPKEDIRIKLEIFWLMVVSRDFREETRSQITTSENQYLQISTSI